MAQHDYVIDNGTGANVRADINLSYKAILTNNSGTTDPATVISADAGSKAFSFWADTNSSPAVMKIRNAADNDWIELFQLDGTFTLEDGSASTPALAFRDDLNTGIFSSAADTFEISTGGTRAMTIDSSQRVLIGTSTEGQDIANDLTIANTTNSGITIRSGTANTGSLFFSDATSGNGELMGAISYSHDNDSLKFYTNASLATGTPRLMIDSSGRLLLGTTTEGVSGADELTVNTPSGHGGITIRNANDSNGNIFFSDGTSGPAEFAGFIQYQHNTDDLVFGVNGSTRITIDNSGNCGIGTISPTEKLHVYQDASDNVLALFEQNTLNQGNLISFKQTTTGPVTRTAFVGHGGDATGNLIIQNSGELVLKTNGSNTALTIDTSQNVGIGTTNPNAKLEVAGSSARIRSTDNSSDAILDFYGQANSNGAIIRSYGADGSAGHFNFRNANTNALVIESSGKVGIGESSPLSRLHIEDPSGAVLTLGNSQDPNDVVAGTVFGRINFFASDRSGTTSTGGVARIEAIASAAYGTTPSELLFYTHDATANDGTVLGNPSERMRIDSSGNVGIGTSPSAKLHVLEDIYVKGSSGDGSVGIQIRSAGSALSNQHQIRTGGGSGEQLFIEALGSSSAVVTKVNGSERMRIDSSGNVIVGRTNTTINTTNFGHVLFNDGTATNSRNVNSTDAVMQSHGNAGTFRIMGDGDAENTNNSYGSISDETLKQDIVDATSQWNDIKNLRVRKFRFKDNPTGALQIGVVAQEIEKVSAGLVKEDSDGIKSVKYSILYMKAVKCLQEAMTKIETLEAKVEALEAA